MYCSLTDLLIDIAGHPVSQEVNATGVRVTLECTATSEGEITHWLHDGAVIDASVDSGVEITFSGGNGAGSSSSMLAITSYETSRAGDYRCVARSLSSEFLVEVSHGAILSHFSKLSLIVHISSCLHWLKWYLLSQHRQL